MTPNNPLGIRVIELPGCKMASAAGADLEQFDRWWSEVDKKRVDKFYPRDFMYHDSLVGQLVWLYALPQENADAGPYQSFAFPGGLYAVAVSVDQDDTDGERVYQQIKEWIKTGASFVLDETQDRHTLFHVITPDGAYQKMKYRQLDIYVPIR
jgi:hypothetical protein